MKELLAKCLENGITMTIWPADETGIVEVVFVKDVVGTRVVFVKDDVGTGVVFDKLSLTDNEEAVVEDILLKSVDGFLTEYERVMKGE